MNLANKKEVSIFGKLISINLFVLEEPGFILSVTPVIVYPNADLYKKQIILENKGTKNFNI